MIANMASAAAQTVPSRRRGYSTDIGSPCQRIMLITNCMQYDTRAKDYTADITSQFVTELFMSQSII